MESITLRTQLRETLEQYARQESKNVNDLVNEAVERYLLEQQRVKIEQEIKAYEAMHAELKQKHLGKWVAFHDKLLVDVDEDRTELYTRIRAKYGRTAVLIRQVREQPFEEIWIRTPSTGKITP